MEALAFTASVPAEESLVADLSGIEQRGRSFGLYTLASDLGAVVEPLASGWLHNQVEHTQHPSILALPLAFLGVLLILPLVREPAHPSAAQHHPHAEQEAESADAAKDQDEEQPARVSFTLQCSRDPHADH